MKKKKDRYKGSMRLRYTLTILIASILVCTATMGCAYAIYSSTLIYRYENLCKTVSETVSGSIDGDRIDPWLDKQNTSDYVETYNMLKQLNNEVSGLTCIKLYKMEEDGMYTIFDTESTKIKGGVGTFSPYDSKWGEYKNDFLANKEVGKIIVNGTAGKILMYCVPVFDSKSNCVCYACSGIAMDLINKEQYAFLEKYSMLLIMLTLIIAFAAIIYKELSFTKPLKYISKTSDILSNSTSPVMAREALSYRVRTGDEIENIWRSLTKIYTDKAQLSGLFQSIQDDTVVVLANLIKRKDGYTGTHIDNTIQYVMLLTNALRKKDKYKDVITDDLYNNILHAAPLHDIGKIMIPDSILNKPAKLTGDEFEKMKQHTLFGAKLIEETEKNVENAQYLEMARELAESHHERWDGKGYPFGLKGEEIPLAVRIITIADVFDALISKRCYRDKLSVDEAYDIIVKERGTHFDPDIIDTFVEIKDEIAKTILS